MYSIKNKNNRRFGVEIEINTFDGIIRRGRNDVPDGAVDVALIIRNILNQKVEIQSWDHNFNNDFWIIKPDSSCGIEVCSPVMKGTRDLKNLIKVVEEFKKKGVNADERCSFHVHMSIEDLSQEQLASVIAWYIKCEHVFIDSVPSYRKVNRYCQVLGMTDIFYDKFPMDPEKIISSISDVKYYSLNTYHFMKGGGFTSNNKRKKTIEFRIGENEMCLDGLHVKNWIKLLLHFIEVTKNKPLPKEYKKGDQWSGLLWLDPENIVKVLNFDKKCSNGLNQVKEWFIKRILINTQDSGISGVWSDEVRSFSRNYFLNLLNIDLNEDKKESREFILYNQKYDS